MVPGLIGLTRTENARRLRRRATGIMKRRPSILIWFALGCHGGSSEIASRGAAPPSSALPDPRSQPSESVVAAGSVRSPDEPVSADDMPNASATMGDAGSAVSAEASAAADPGSTTDARQRYLDRLAAAMGVSREQIDSREWAGFRFCPPIPRGVTRGIAEVLKPAWRDCMSTRRAWLDCSMGRGKVSADQAEGFCSSFQARAPGPGRRMDADQGRLRGVETHVAGVPESAHEQVGPSLSAYP